MASYEKGLASWAEELVQEFAEAEETIDEAVRDGLRDLLRKYYVEVDVQRCVDEVRRFIDLHGRVPDEKYVEENVTFPCDPFQDFMNLDVDDLSRLSPELRVAVEDLQSTCCAMSSLTRQRRDVETFVENSRLQRLPVNGGH